MADNNITTPGPQGPTSPPDSEGYLCGGCGRRIPVNEALPHVKFDCDGGALGDTERALLLAISALSALIYFDPPPGTFDLAECERAIHLLIQMAATLEA